MLDVNNLLGFQPKTPQRSSIRLQGIVQATGVSYLRCFSNVYENIGNDLTWRRDAVFGDRIIINADGVYGFAYGDVSIANNSLYIVKNLAFGEDPTNASSKHLAAAVTDNGINTTIRIDTGPVVLRAGETVAFASVFPNVGSNTATHLMTATRIS